MTGYVADLSWKSGARAIEKLDRLRSTMAVNVLKKVEVLKHHVSGTVLTSQYETEKKLCYTLSTSNINYVEVLLFIS